MVPQEGSRLWLGIANLLARLVTLAVYTVCLGLGLSSVGTRFGPHGHLVVGGVLTIALLAVVALKGEPLRVDRDRVGESDDSVRRLDSYRISAYLIQVSLSPCRSRSHSGWYPRTGPTGFAFPVRLPARPRIGTTSTKWREYPGLWQVSFQ